MASSKSPGSGSPGGGNSGGGSSGGESPGGESPRGESPGSESPGEGIPGGGSPRNESPVGGSPGGGNSGDESPGGESPRGGSPRSESPGGGSPGGESLGIEISEAENLETENLVERNSALEGLESPDTPKTTTEIPDVEAEATEESTAEDREKHEETPEELATEETPDPKPDDRPLHPRGRNQGDEFWGSIHPVPPIGDENRKFLFAPQVKMAPEEQKRIVEAYNETLCNKKPLESTLLEELRPSTPRGERARRRKEELEEATGEKLSDADYFTIWDQETINDGFLAALQIWCVGRESIPLPYVNKIIHMMDSLEYEGVREVARLREKMQHDHVVYDMRLRAQEEQSKKLAVDNDIKAETKLLSQKLLWQIKSLNDAVEKQESMIGELGADFPEIQETHDAHSSEWKNQYSKLQKLAFQWKAANDLLDQDGGYTDENVQDFKDIERRTQAQLARVQKCVEDILADDLSGQDKISQQRANEFDSIRADIKDYAQQLDGVARDYFSDISPRRRASREEADQAKTHFEEVSRSTNDAFNAFNNSAEKEYAELDDQLNRKIKETENLRAEIDLINKSRKKLLEALNAMNNNDPSLAIPAVEQFKEFVHDEVAQDIWHRLQDALAHTTSGGESISLILDSLQKSMKEKLSPDDFARVQPDLDKAAKGTKELEEYVEKESDILSKHWVNLKTNQEQRFNEVSYKEAVRKKDREIEDLQQKVSQLLAAKPASLDSGTRSASEAGDSTEAANKKQDELQAQRKKDDDAHATEDKKLQDQLRQSTASVEDLKLKLKESEAELSQKTQELEASRKTAGPTELEHERDELLARCEQLQNDLRKSQQEVAMHKTALHMVETERNKFRKEARELQKRLDDIDDVQSKYKASQEVTRGLETQLGSLQKQLEIEKDSHKTQERGYELEMKHFQDRHKQEDETISKLGDTLAKLGKFFASNNELSTESHSTLRQLLKQTMDEVGKAREERDKLDANYSKIAEENKQAQKKPKVSLERIKPPEGPNIQQSEANIARRTAEEEETGSAQVLTQEQIRGYKDQVEGIIQKAGWYSGLRIGQVKSSLEVERLFTRLFQPDEDEDVPTEPLAPTRTEDIQAFWKMLTFQRRRADIVSAIKQKNFALADKEWWELDAWRTEEGFAWESTWPKSEIEGTMKYLRVMLNGKLGKAAPEGEATGGEVPGWYERVEAMSSRQPWKDLAEHLRAKEEKKGEHSE